MTDKKPTYKELEDKIIELSKSSDNISDAIYSKIIGNIGDVVVIIDKNGINKYKSPNIEKLFGWKPYEVVGKKNLENVHSKDVESAKKFFNKLMHKPNSIGAIEIRYKCKNGSYSWIELTGTNLLHDPDIKGFLGNYHDITERKIAEEKHNANSANMAAIIENTTDSIWAINRVYEIMYVNSVFKQSYFESFGVILEPGVNLYESLPEPLKPVWKERYDRTLNNERFEIVDAIDVGTRTIYIEVSFNPIVVNNKVIGASFFGRDVSERKKVEETLKLKNQVFDASIVANSIADINGIITEANKAFLLIWGYTSADEVIGKPISDFMQNNDEAIEIVSALNNTGIWEGDYTAKRKDNSSFVAHGLATTIKNKNDEMIGYQSSVMDVTAKKLAELELIEAKEKAEEKEQQLRLISNNLVDGMIYQVVTIDEEKRKFNFVSETVNKLYGCTVEEALKDPNLIYGKIHKDDVNRLINEENEALKNMSTFKTEVRVINPDNSIRWSYYISKPRLINNLICWDGIEVDITEQKRIEQELILAKEKAEESDQLKSAFLANMSHEIRSPMNAIVGFSELLNNRDLSEEKKEMYLEQVNSGSERLLNIISDIIDVSKIDANQLSINLGACNINKIIDNLYAQYSISSVSPEVNIKHTKGLTDKDSIIKSDEQRLIQILSNLLENAIKFTKKGIIEFGYSLKNNMLQFYVKDKGKGIDPKNHKLIFDRFGQVKQEYTKSGSGTGLGLSIAKGLVELLKGEIWVESEIDKGAVFYFTVPYNKIEKKDIEETINSSFESETAITVLIAEDDYPNYLYLEELLSVFNYSIIHATSGKEAIELFKKNNSIDLILMDIKMPIMNGIDATLEIRKLNKNIPIIAQTAYAMADDRDKVIKAGCNDYIAKPIAKIELAKIINKYILRS